MLHALGVYRVIIISNFLMKDLHDVLENLSKKIKMVGYFSYIFVQFLFVLFKSLCNSYGPKKHVFYVCFMYCCHIFLHQPIVGDCVSQETHQGWMSWDTSYQLIGYSGQDVFRGWIWGILKNNIFPDVIKYFATNIKCLDCGLKSMLHKW
jgi:hypothetical protein